jgi:xanthine/uracil/vitamin C permease (AzgA family)
MSERTDDPLIAQREQAELEAHRSARAANLFDVRRFIGGLFAIYGLILTVMGIGASDADIDRAAGINVNLWTGLAMLAVAALFVFWALSRPLAEELEEAPTEGDRTVRALPRWSAPTRPR